MSDYTLTIKTSEATRKALASKGFNLVFAKGVSSGGETDYNAAWIVLKPDEMAENMKISWDVDYFANFTTSQLKNRAKIEGTSNDLKMYSGGAYVVDASGELIVDPNVSPNPNPSKSSFSFHNNQGYSLEYVPILESKDNKGKRVPIWAASTGVTKNGLIAATPVERVRVWAGKYEQGQAVLAEYVTVIVEFDLTTIRGGKATFNDDLSVWTDLSSNATTFQPNANSGITLASVRASGYVQHGQKHRCSGNFSMERAINALYLEWKISDSNNPQAITFEVWVDISLGIDKPLFYGKRLKSGDNTTTNDENIDRGSFYIANPQGTDSDFLVTVIGHF